MTDAFFSQFHAAIVEVDAMEHVRVCVIHAEGRMFSCGLDLGASAEMFGKLADGSSSKRSQVTKHCSVLLYISSV
jgi:enoyl-CoA hydratase/carnithine racemase